ncbi:MAG: GTP-binding protein [Oculatellaceae cyanobacterium Prado106]|nr:GTP-binding protein [Oculatellaceae cyanobacterium Prado106]
MNPLDSELEETIQGFGEIQAELNYRQAQDVLRDLVGNLDLTPRERTGLETEIQSLETMLDKLDRQVVHLAVFGLVGRGKSSLLNALLGQDLFETGATHGVTQTIQTAQWSAKRETLSGGNGDLLRVTLPGLGASQIELIDTPGIDEVDGETREMMARQLAKQADLILFVVAGDMTQVEFAALSELRQASKPILLVFNKVDQYPEADRLAIYEKIRDERVKQLLSPDEIVMAAASPLIARAIRQPDGKLISRLSRSTPQVDDLKLKILEILHREGKSLVALNTMLYTGNINEQLVQRKMEIRDRSANQIIWNGVMTTAVAIAVNPVTVIDMLSGMAIDVAMLLALSRLYGIPMTQTGAIGLLKKIAIGLGGVTASELIATLGLGSLKSFLGITAPVTGGASLTPYISVALTQASVAGVSTYGIGQVAKTYFANGASWGEEGPKAVVERILSSLDEASILSRIKTELRTKLEGGAVDSEDGVPE